jgi:crossover junction endodeoxyribonuclease RuvC
MKILGVDPGGRAAGWAIVSFEGAPRLVAAGVLRPRAGGPFVARLLALRDGLLEVIDRERPDAAAVERVFAGKNPQSLIALGEARGALLVALGERGIPTAELTPAEIKKSVTGSGIAEKVQVRRMVAALLDTAHAGRLALDAADAAAAALAHGFVAARHTPLVVRRAPEAPPGEPARVVRRRPSG